MNILCKVFVKVVQLCDTKKDYKKMPKKIPILFRYSKQSCVDIFVFLKSPQKIRGLNY